MRRETHAVRESLHRSGRWLDVVGYALLADEWPATPGTHPSEIRATTAPPSGSVER